MKRVQRSRAAEKAVDQESLKPARRGGLDVNTSSRAKRSREYLTADEIGKLLTAAKTATRNPVRDYAALLLMFRHGLRVSELCSIKLSDIDVKHKTFHVNRLKDCDSGPHDLYNGESQAVKAWLVERAKMKVPADCDTLCGAMKYVAIEVLESMRVVAFVL